MSRAGFVSLWEMRRKDHSDRQKPTRGGGITSLAVVDDFLKERGN